MNGLHEGLLTGNNNGLASGLNADGGAGLHNGLQTPYVRSKFTPLALNPVLWIDAINGRYTSTVDTNGIRAKGNIIDSSLAMTGQALAAGGGAAGNKFIYNGEGWFCKLAAEMTTGTVSSYEFLHNGQDYYISFVYFQTKASSGNQRCLFTTNDFSSTAKGVLCYYDNSGGANSLRYIVGNQTTGHINLTMSGAITQNTTNRIEIIKTGNTVRVLVNNVQVGTQTSTGWAAGNSVGVMRIAGTPAATATIYLKDFVICNRVLTGSERVKMNSRTFLSITPKNIGVDFYWGDSNGAGQAPNAGIATELNGKHNVLVLRQGTGAISTSDFIEQLQLGTNQVRTNQDTTKHGAEMRCGYSYSLIGADRAILKFTEGSTDMAAWTSPGLQYTRSITAITEFMDDIYHVHRRKPKLRVIVQIHGANDVQVGDGANYKTGNTAFIKAVIDTWNGFNTLFEATVFCRIIVFRLKTGSGVSNDPTAEAIVRTAQQDIGNGSVPVDEPTVAAYIAGSTWFDTDSLGTVDGTHYNAAAYDSMGTSWYNYVIPFANE